MNRYPHSLYVSQNSDNATLDANGNWVSDTAEWEHVGECREEPNGSGRSIILEDGKAFQYSSMIYLPELPASITNGSAIKVTGENDAIRFTGIVSRCSSDRKNARIWA